MGSIVKFAAVNSKIKAIIGKSISREQYFKLQKCKDIKSIVKILKDETNYKKILEHCIIEKVNRVNLEMILHKNYISIYSKFINYFNGEYRKLIKILFIRWEIEDLKVIIRGKYLGDSKRQIENKIAFRSSLNTINYDYLIALKNVEDIIDALKGSIYYNSLKIFIKDIGGKNLFRIETELDFVYFMSIRKKLNHLDNENKEVGYRITGMEADLLNLGWIYRGKTFYKIPPEELFNYIIYNGFKFSKRKLIKLCYANDMVEFYNLIEKTPYAYIYENDDLACIEKREREFQKKYYKKILRENRNDISMVMSYIMFYMIEVRDIISIIEQKKYTGGISK